MKRNDGLDGGRGVHPNDRPKESWKHIGPIQPTKFLVDECTVGLASFVTICAVVLRWVDHPRHSTQLVQELSILGCDSSQSSASRIRTSTALLILGEQNVAVIPCHNCTQNNCICKNILGFHGKCCRRVCYRTYEGESTFCI